ncbi:hypothetical protein THAOC_05305, partial [Thalassiosira oceanica]
MFQQHQALSPGRSSSLRASSSVSVGSRTGNASPQLLARFISGRVESLGESAERPARRDETIRGRRRGAHEAARGHGTPGETRQVVARAVPLSKATRARQRPEHIFTRRDVILRSAGVRPRRRPPPTEASNGGHRQASSSSAQQQQQQQQSHQQQNHQRLTFQEDHATFEEVPIGIDGSIHAGQYDEHEFSQVTLSQAFSHGSNHSASTSAADKLARR